MDPLGVQARSILCQVSGPRRTNQGQTGQIRAPWDESGWRDRSGPALWTRATQNEIWPLGRIRAIRSPKDESGPRKTALRRFLYVLVAQWAVPHCSWCPAQTPYNARVNIYIFLDNLIKPEQSNIWLWPGLWCHKWPSCQILYLVRKSESSRHRAIENGVWVF